jgi:hypothetical protein
MLNFWEVNYPKNSIPEPLSLNVLKLLDILEINLIVVHVGLMELQKLSMIEFVLKLVIPLYYLLLILLDAVDSFHVSLWDVTEDKLLLHGTGLIE